VNGKGCAVLVLTLLLTHSGALGDDRVRQGLTRGQCVVQPDPGWTPQEKFVWQRVCSGEAADFNEEPNYGGKLDPKKTELPEIRILRPAFIETILFGDKYRHAVTRLGVTIIGARFTEAVDLSGADLQYDLGLIGCLMEKGADFKWLKSPRSLALIGSKIAGWLDMVGLDVQQNLNMYGTELGPVNLADAQIGGQLSLDRSAVGGPLNMSSIHIRRHLLMAEAKLGEIILGYARVDGQISLRNSTVYGRLHMDGLHVDHDLLMYLADFRNKVELNEAYIGGQFSLSGSKFSGDLNMTSLQVGANVFVHPARLRSDGGAGAEQVYETEFEAPISLYFGKIGGSLDLIGTFRSSVDLTGTQIGGDLRLGKVELTGPQLGGAPNVGESTEEAHWSQNAALILKNVKAGALQDLPDAWPNTVDLNGFTYGGLGGMSDAGKHLVINRAVEDFEAWLGKQRPYSPPPYEQLAKVLRNQGRPDAADSILYAGKERERAEAPLPTYIVLTLSKWFIGYGYHLFQSLIWISGFLILGALLLRVSKQGSKISRHYNTAYGLVYSFDLLLPLIKLREKHYNIDLNGWIRYYFYIHRIMGFLLASFLVAGLSGLAK
jgi:hypothetical protein